MLHLKRGARKKWRCCTLNTIEVDPKDRGQEEDESIVAKGREVILSLADRLRRISREDREGEGEDQKNGD